MNPPATAGSPDAREADTAMSTSPNVAELTGNNTRVLIHLDEAPELAAMTCRRCDGPAVAYIIGDHWLEEVCAAHGHRHLIDVGVVDGIPYSEHLAPLEVTPEPGRATGAAERDGCRQCSRCPASWLADAGDICPWCIGYLERAHRRRVDALLALGDRHLDAWGRQLRTAVALGIITAGEARTAVLRARGRARREVAR